MKFAGIKGVVIDWYGIEDFRDCAMIHRNTKHLIKYIKKAELRFAICYEDQTVKHMIESKFLQKQEGLSLLIVNISNTIVQTNILVDVMEPWKSYSDDCFSSCSSSIQLEKIFLPNSGHYLSATRYWGPAKYATHLGFL